MCPRYKYFMVTKTAFSTNKNNEAEGILFESCSGHLQFEVFTSSKNLRELTIAVSEFQSDVEKVTATAYSTALAAAYNYKEENGCLAWVNAGGCIWTEGHPDEQTYCAECTVITHSVGAVDAIDAIAEACACLIRIFKLNHNSSYGSLHCMRAGMIRFCSNRNRKIVQLAEIRYIYWTKRCLQNEINTG
jgi:hypothetical protein